MPSIAYRLARVAAGDGIAGVSLYRVSPHDVVAGHALLRAVGGDLLDQDGQPIRYDNLNKAAVPKLFRRQSGRQSTPVRTPLATAACDPLTFRALLPLASIKVKTSCMLAYR